MGLGPWGDLWVAFGAPTDLKIMATLSKIKPGDVLWDVRRERMGNTMLRRTAVRPVKVLEVHDDHAVVSWNHNSPQKYYAKSLSKLKVKKPETKEG